MHRPSPSGEVQQALEASKANGALASQAINRGVQVILALMRSRRDDLEWHVCRCCQSPGLVTSLLGRGQSDSAQSDGVIGQPLTVGVPHRQALSRFPVVHPCNDDILAWL